MNPNLICQVQLETTKIEYRAHVPCHLAEITLSRDSESDDASIILCIKYLENEQLTKIPRSLAFTLTSKTQVREVSEGLVIRIQVTLSIRLCPSSSSSLSSASSVQLNTFRQFLSSCLKRNGHDLETLPIYNGECGPTKVKPVSLTQDQKEMARIIKSKSEARTPSSITYETSYGDHETPSKKARFSHSTSHGLLLSSSPVRQDVEEDPFSFPESESRTNTLSETHRSTISPRLKQMNGNPGLTMMLADSRRKTIKPYPFLSPGVSRFSIPRSDFNSFDLDDRVILSPRSASAYTSRTGGPRFPSMKPVHSSTSFYSPSSSAKVYGRHLASAMQRSRASSESPTQHNGGLRNLGQTCYIAAILQMLYHTPLRRKLLSFRKEYPMIRANAPVDALPSHGDLDKENKERPKGEAVLEAVCDLFERKQAGRDVSLEDVKRRISKVTRQFSKYSQEDAHEFLVVLNEILFEELISKTASKSEVTNPNQNPVSETFEFQIRHQLVCTQCTYTSTTFEPFRDLSIDLETPESSQNPTVLSLLQAFFRDEKVGYVCELCQAPESIFRHAMAVSTDPSGEGSDKEDSKGKEIGVSPPETLVIHLKRFEVNLDASGALSFRKKHDDVTIPLMLDLSSILASPIESSVSKPDLPAHIYQLKGIVSHLGADARSGHYVYDAYDTVMRTWKTFDDSRVTSGKDMHVKRKDTAYILQYERVESVLVL